MALSHPVGTVFIAAAPGFLQRGWNPGADAISTVPTGGDKDGGGRDKYGPYEERLVSWCLLRSLPTCPSHRWGITRGACRQFQAWTDALMRFDPGMMQAQQHFVPYYLQASEERRKTPGNDILSLLIAAEIDGERLSYPDLMSFCFTLFIAGNITTTT